MTRNLILAGTLIATCAISICGLLTPRTADTAPASSIAPAPPLQLELGLLLQRETPEGDWRQLRAGMRPRRGDELQLTVKPLQAGYLMVAFTDHEGRRPQIVYPLPGQTGEVRAGWAYALPDPSRSFTLDGEPTRLVVLLSGDRLPRELDGRLAVLRAAARRPAPAPEPGETVQLELRDGTPAPVPIRRYAAPQPLAAVVGI